jgi:twitching motility protein PilI
MARASLREYQLALSERLQGAAAGTRVPTKLGLRAGGEAWLVDLKEAGEVIPVPVISPVPLVHGWFKGVANVRGNLYSVSDLGALLGQPATPLSDRARLLLVADRFRAGASLLIESSLGLRNADDLKPRAGEAVQRWVRAHYEDKAGTVWKELDVAALIHDEAFLEVSV